jgi:hypothetical protein
VASFENANSTLFSWLSSKFVISLSYDSCCCATHIGVNKTPVLTVIISIIPQWRSLKNVRYYSLCHRRHDIKMHNNYYLSAVCPRLNIACKRFVSYCKQSFGYFLLFSQRYRQDSLKVPTTQVTKKQRTNKLGCCYLPQHHFRCSLATRCHAGQPNLYTVGPRVPNAPGYEQFGLLTNFPGKKLLGLRTVSRVTNTIWQQRQTESISAGVSS